MATLACPNNSWTRFGCTLRAKSRVAQVCLRSWNRIVLSPARFSTGLEERLRRFEGLMIVPVSVAKTRPPGS